MAFNTGDTATGAQGLIFEMDVLRNGTWSRFCMSGVTENLNPQSTTWQDICSMTTNTALTGIDPEWSGEIVVRYDSAVGEFLKRRYDGLENLQNIPVRITNLLLDERIQFLGMLSELEITGEGAELITASFTLKVFNGQPVPTHFEPGTYANINYVLQDVAGLGVANTRIILTNSTNQSISFNSTSMVDGTGLLPLIPLGDYAVSFDNIPEGLQAPEAEILTVELTTGMQTYIFVESAGTGENPEPTGTIAVVGEDALDEGSIIG